MNTELSPQSAWEDYVGKAIGDLKKKHPTLNLSQIAMKINLNRSTLNRIINEGIKPQLDNYIKIIVGSGNGGLLSPALTAYDDSLVGRERDLSTILSYQKNASQIPVELEKILEDHNNYLSYLLALKNNGTDLKEVVHVLGNRGLSSIDELTNLGLIENINGRIKSKNNLKNINSTFESLKKRLATFSQFYKTEHCMKKRNYIHTVSEGMNEEGILKMQDLHRRFHREMLEITSAEENQGSIPMFSVAFADSLTSINYNSKQELLQ